MVIEDPFDKFCPQGIPDNLENISLATPKKLELHPYISQIKQLQKKVPVVGDKALIDLVSGIYINGEIISYRQNRNFFGRLIDTLSGGDYQRNLLTQNNLVQGQNTLSRWILELNSSLNISLVGLCATQKSLELTQISLLETRQAIRNQHQKFSEFNQLIENIRDDLSNRISKLEVLVEANQDLERIVDAWTAEKTYADLPWAMQVSLLAREVFSSSIILYELQNNDIQFRERLINKIIRESKYREVPKKFNGFSDLLNRAWNDIQNTQDHELLVSLFEPYSMSLPQLKLTPHIFVLGETLKLSMLPPETRPKNPETLAMALCQSHIGDVQNIETPEEFITAIIQETANYCSSTIQVSKRKWK